MERRSRIFCFQCFLRVNIQARSLVHSAMSKVTAGLCPLTTILLFFSLPKKTVKKAKILLSFLFSHLFIFAPDKNQGSF